VNAKVSGISRKEIIMKILIADSFLKEGIKELEKLCGTGNLVADANLKGDALKQAIKGINVLVVRSTKIPRDVIESADSLSLIVRAGAGVENIDAVAASERGIYVANCPGKNAIAVAELTMGLILALDRRIPENVADLQKKVWNKKEYSKADGLAGKTLGLVGFGNIAQAVATRAKATHRRKSRKFWRRICSGDYNTCKEI
jgi:D-3-phosphoglycerate dehydrogenase